MKESLTGLLDLFYPPFKRLMPLQTFRYAACGGANTLLGLSIYWVSLYYIFNNTVFHFGQFALKPHNAALFLSSCIVFCVGFLLNKYIVFVASDLRGRVQVFRYFLSFFLNLVVNYFILKLLVEALFWSPFYSQLLTTSIIIAIGYLTQKHFTFRTRNNAS